MIQTDKHWNMINIDSNISKQYTIPRILESIIEDEVKDIIQRLIYILKWRDYKEQGWLKNNNLKLCKF